MKMLARFTGIIQIILAISLNINAQRIFPGAVGFGTESRGAYQGSSTPTILIVDNLYPGSKQTGENRGSFEWCLTQPYPRIVIFEVSGVIDYTKSDRPVFALRNPYLSVYGQTSPERGITLLGLEIYIYTNDVLFQHIRFRQSDQNDAYLQNRCVSTTAGTGNVVFDHCSFAFANDEVFTVYDSKRLMRNITLSNSIIAWPLHESWHANEGGYHEPEMHGLNSIDYGVTKMTHYRNLIAFGNGRNPLTWADSVVLVNSYSYTSASAPGAGPTISIKSDVSNPAAIMKGCYSWNPGAVNSIQKSSCGLGNPGTFLENNFSRLKLENPSASEIECTYNPAGHSLASKPHCDTLWFNTIQPQNLYSHLKSNAGAFYWNRDHVDQAVFDSIDAGAKYHINSPVPLPARAFNRGNGITGYLGDGYDFSVNNVSFTVNGKVINLTKNASNVYDVLNMINSQLPDGVEAIKHKNPWSDYIVIQTIGTGSDKVLTIGGNASVLGISAGTYRGENGLAGGYPSYPSYTKQLSVPLNPHLDDDGDGYTNIEEWAAGFIPDNECSALSVRGITEDEIDSDQSGTIDVTVESGNAPYSYLWNDGSTLEDRKNLSSGDYSIKVTDDLGCEITKLFKVNNNITESPDTTENTGGELPSGNKIAVTSISQEGNTKEGYDESKMIDGSLGTFWASNANPARAILSLGANFFISDFAIAFYKGDQRHTFFSISVSSDSVSWTEVFNGISYSNTVDFEYFNLQTPVEGAYIKFKGFGNDMVDRETWTSIVEFEAWGEYSSPLTTEDTTNTNENPYGANPRGSKIDVSNISFANNTIEGYDESKMLDEDLRTRWSSNADPAVSVFSFDGIYNISDFGLAFYKGDLRYTKFAISVSSDSINWRELYNGNSNGDTKDLEYINLNTPVEAVYVKLQGYGNTMEGYETWTSITEFEAWGEYVGPIVQNNNPPLIEDSNITIDDNIENGSIITKVTSSDPDEGQVLTYTIISGNISNTFSIDNNGNISINNNSSLLSIDNFNLIAKVIDNGMPALSATASIGVTVSHINDSPVVENAKITIQENMESGELVKQISASDPDIGQTLSYSIISGNANNAFSIDNSGNIKINVSSALQSTENFILVVKVTDNGSPSLSSEATVDITIEKIINNAPVVGDKTITISDELEVGSLVGNLGAFDSDEGQVLNYQILLGNSGEAFQLDNLGNIILNTDINLPEIDVFYLTVQVSDNGEPSKSNNAVITIMVNHGVKNSSPVLNKTTFYIIDTVGIGSVIGKVSAFDNEQDELTYSLMNYNQDWFDLDESTGEIFLINEIYISNDTKVDLDIQVTDNGEGNLSSSEIFSINIYHYETKSGAINSEPVVILNYEDVAYSGMMKVIDASGSYDPDNDNLSYRWIVPNGIEVENSNSNSLSFLVPQVYNSVNQKLTVEVSDGESKIYKTIDVTFEPYKPEIPEIEISSIKSSGYDGSNFPIHIVDNNSESYWTSNGEGEWVSLEFKNEVSLSHLKIAFFDTDDKKAKFDLHVSKDGREWFSVAENVESCGFSSSYHIVDLDSKLKSTETYKFIKFIGYGNNLNQQNSISELEIFGDFYSSSISNIYDDNIKIFPNPSSGFVKIQVPEKSIVRVVGVTGRVLFEKELFAGETELNLDVSPGSYFVQFLTVGQEVLTRKLIIK